MGQVISQVEIDKSLKSIRTENKKIVFTNGCFDLLHVGHVRYLNSAKKLGDILIVGVNTDKSVKKLKGPTRPIQNENDRAEILAALGAVDYVVLFDEDTPLELIHQIKPDILTKGGDYKIETIVGAEYVMARGGQVLPLEFFDGKSTSLLVSKMKS